MNITDDNYLFVEKVLNTLYGGQKEDDIYVIYVITKKKDILEIMIHNIENYNCIKKYFDLPSFFKRTDHNPETFYYIYIDGPSQFWC